MKVFVGLGGNFLERHAGHPIHRRGDDALPADRADLHQAQPRSPHHRRAGADPPLPRPHRTGRAEDRASSSSPWRTPPAWCTSRAASCRPARSTCAASRPSSAGWRSRPSALGTGPRSTVDWQGLIDDYDRIREHIEHVVPGFAQYNRRVREPGGFYLPNGPREGMFPTPSGRARFTVHPIPEHDLCGRPAAADHAAQPRSVQHDHLRRERSLPRDPRRAAGGLPQRGRHARASDRKEPGR